MGKKNTNKECCSTFSCMDCCFGPMRAPERFDPSKNNKLKLDAQDVLILITSNAVGILTLVCIEIVLVCLWIALCFVPGFALYDGTPGHAHPVSHYGWWFIIEFAVVIAGCFVYKFKLSSTNLSPLAKFEYSIVDARNTLVFYVCMLVLGAISNIVHFSLTLVENSYCTSSFCRGFNVVDPINASLLAQPPTTSAYLILFIVLLSLLVILQIFLIFRSLGYRRHLLYAVWRDKSLFDAKSAVTLLEQQEGEEEEEDQDTSENVEVKIAQQQKFLDTPFLRSLNNNRKDK